jgi:hypothetical protein
MYRSELLKALEQLGAHCPPGSEIVLAGGAALILGGYIERGTSDGDVIDADPRLTEIADLVAAVADERRLPATWLNDGVRGFLDVLPPDYRERLEEVATFENLRVLRLGRLDLIVMKFFALRPQDLEDLAALAPRADEIEFVRGQLERIARARPDKAFRMQLYLEQGASLYARPDASGDDPGRREDP